MVFVRGQADDYNGWAQRGHRGWSYADLLPYFWRIEWRIEWRIDERADERYRGRDGLLPMTDRDWTHPLCDAFIAGAQSLVFHPTPIITARGRRASDTING
jgi:choline dehydrogenase